jgi:surface polysaccharide O-acyltransferase-like enzyme
LALWLGASALTFNREASLGVQAAADFAFVVACACGCFFLIGISVRFAASRSRTLGALGANAYGLYLLHYVFIVWLQFALLALPLLALIKAPLVFAGTLLFTWTVNATLTRHALGARLIGSAPRPLAKFAS